MSELDPDALDRWILSGRYHEELIDVWCQNPECASYGRQSVVVKQQIEYGIATWAPSECPLCGGDLDEEQPDPEDDG